MARLVPVADDLQRLLLAERPAHGVLDLLGVAGFENVSHCALGLFRRARVRFSGKGRHDLAREAAQLVLAAGDGEQHVGDAGPLQGLNMAAISSGVPKSAFSSVAPALSA